MLRTRTRTRTSVVALTVLLAADAGTVLLAVLPAASCGYVFPRSDGITPGEVRGRAVRIDVGDEGAAFARVTLNGSNLSRRALSDGTFSIAGLRRGTVALRLDDDADGDGWPDRGGYAAALLTANTSAGGNDTTFVLLGDVALNGTMQVSGTVTLDDGTIPAASGFVARVYVTRGLCFSIDADVLAATTQATCGADVNRVEAGAEAVTSADASGAFLLDGVLPGDVEVSVVLYADDGGGVGPALSIAGPILASGDAANDPSGVDIVVAAPGPLGTRDVQVATSPAAGEDSIAILSEPGAPSSCASPPDVDNVTTFALGGANVVLSAPLGVWDVTVCDGALVGRAFAQLALAASDPGDLPPLWSVSLFDGDPCTRAQADDVIDCDGDGLVQLPPFNADDEASVTLWNACTEQCAALGEALGAASCDEGFDCDDDADGQGDTTEVAACIGAGLGNDLDGDRLCSTTDPYPQCTANDAVACPAGTNDVNPQPVASAPIVEPGIPQCGEAFEFVPAGFNGARDLEVIGDQMYVMGSSGIDRFPLDVATGIVAAGSQTVLNLVNFEDMASLTLSGTTLFAAGGPVQADPVNEPSRLWVVDVTVPEAPVGQRIDLTPASVDPEFLIAELDGAVLSSRFVAADGANVYVLEHTSGGDVIALDRTALASGTLDVTATHDFAAPIDARAALVVGSHLAIVAAQGSDGSGPAVIFLAVPDFGATLELPLTGGAETLGGMAATESTLFVADGNTIRGYDIVDVPFEVTLAPAFADFHAGAAVRGLALLDASTLLAGSSADGEEHITLFNIDAGAATGFAQLVDQSGFGISATDELTVLGARFVYPTGRRSPATQQVVDVVTCPRE